MDSLYGQDNQNSTRGGDRGGYRGRGDRGRGGYRGRGGNRGGGYGGGGGGYSNDRPVDNGPDLSDRFEPEDKVAVKIRGLPYQTRYEEVADFFQDYKFIQRSVILGLNNEGRKNGFGSILFENQEEAEAAAQGMDEQHVGSRYVNLSVISYGDYKRFNKPAGGGNFGSKTVKLAHYVNDDNKDRSLVMRGLPYRATPEIVTTFFDGFGKIVDEDIFIEEFNGRRTGSALVVFENEAIAQDAKSALHRKEIEGRYIELFDQNDQFMQKICQLETA